MSIRFYKSNFLPDVDFSTDGRLNFDHTTIRDGTFPLSSKGLKELKNYQDEEDTMRRTKEQFQSLDQGRGRRYRKNTPSFRNGSISSGNSVSQRVSSSNFGNSFNLLNGEPNQKEEGLYDSGSLPFNSQASFGSADSKIARKKQKELEKVEIQTVESTDVDDTPLVKEFMPIIERPPAAFFIILGIPLTIVGVVSALLSPWHIAFAQLWTAALVICTGALGISHGGSYFYKCNNWAYIIVSLVAAAASMTASFLIMMVLIPYLHQLPARVAMGIDDATSQNFLHQVTFTRWDPPVDGTGPMLVWLTLVLLLVSFVLVLACLHTLFGTALVFSNFWDSEYRTTGLCDHRFNPFWFNQVHCLRVGQATMVVGCAAVVLCMQPEIPRDLYWMPIASPALVCLAAILAFCYGKRPDKLIVGIFAVFVELLALASLAVALALLTVGCVNDVGAITKDFKAEKQPPSILFTNVAVYAVFAILSMVESVYLIGMTVIQLRRICTTDSKA